MWLQYESWYFLLASLLLSGHSVIDCCRNRKERLGHCHSGVTIVTECPYGPVSHWCHGVTVSFWHSVTLSHCQSVLILLWHFNCGTLTPCLGTKLCPYELIFHACIDEKRTNPFCFITKMIFSILFREIWKLRLLTLQKKQTTNIIKLPYYLSHFIKKIHFLALTFFLGPWTWNRPATGKGWNTVLVSQWHSVTVSVSQYCHSVSVRVMSERWCHSNVTVSVLKWCHSVSDTAL